MKYKTILADPPWNESGGGKIKRGADKHYPLMKTDDIITLMKDDLKDKINEDGCHLYLWVTNNFLQDGFKVLDALGFKYITMITWMKDKQGLGQYYRGLTEHCLFGRMGMLPYKVIDNKRQQGKTGFIERKTIHSKKPEIMYQMIEKVSYEPRYEMFARKRREGWDVTGNEVDNDKIIIEHKLSRWY